ncbi:mucin-21 [Halyomorpha halys]|uniref:mucin-21 n=1 Tax=Halyomorpha halys TaxID=286706 RepID=UPI0006D527E7|nr:uncharacterized protein YBL113C-like [Halyomorpha halys]
MADRKARVGKKVIYKSRSRKDSEVNAEEYDTVVLRNLDPATEIADIKHGLEKIGYKVLSIRNAYSHATGLALPLFFIKLYKTPFNTNIFQLKYMAHQVVIVEEYLQGPDLQRCTRCQGLDHTKSSCTNPSVCAWCSGSHYTTACKDVKTSLPTCCRCGGCHPSSYKGCKVYREKCLMKLLEGQNRNNEAIESKNGSSEISNSQEKTNEEENLTISTSSSMAPDINTTSSSGNQIASAGNTITSAENRMASAGNTITSAENRMASAGSTITSAENRMASAGSTITSAENRMPSAGSTITYAEKRIASAGNTITYAENRIASAGNITYAENRIASAGNTITYAENRIASAGSVITTNKNTIASIKKTIISTKNATTSTKNAITSTKNTITFTNNTITSFSSSIVSASSTAVSAISSAVSASCSVASASSSPDVKYSVIENAKSKKVSAPPEFPPLTINERAFMEQMKIVGDLIDHYSSMNEDLFRKLYD